MPTRFPIINSGAQLDEMVEKMGGKSSRPRLEDCSVCGRPVWRNPFHAHASCLGDRLVRGNPDIPSPVPRRPEPIIGNVYGTLNAARSDVGVSAAAVRESERRAKEALDNAPRCKVCKRPMVADQKSTHHECKDRHDRTPL